MNLTNNSRTKNQQIATLITLLLAAVIALFIISLGKIDSFLFINGRHTETLDLFFKYATHLGDGMMWVPVVIYCLFIKKEFAVPAIAALILSTLFSQFLKRVVFPEELRPISLLAQDIQVHFVEGVKVNQFHSFPSGHTTTAFTIALILAYIHDQKRLSIILPFLAFTVGYSRVYLGQHFVVDVFAGTLLALLSVHLSIKIHELVKKRTSKG